MLKTVGADPENEIMIFTGSGDEFMMDADPEGFKLEAKDLPYWAYEYAYKDGRINVSGGATIQHPGWGGADISFLQFPPLARANLD